MAWFRRSKFGLDRFRSIASKFSIKNSIQESIPSPSASKNGSLLRNSCFQYGIKQNQYSNSPMLYGARRYYYVDRHQVQHFRPRGPNRWFQNPRMVFSVVLVGSGLVITVYLGNLETIPYTKRTHFILLSNDLEKRLGDTQFNQMKKQYKGRILPAIHPESVRVRLIASEIIDSLQRGLRKDQVWSDLHYASGEVYGNASGGNESLMALSDSKPEANWSKQDEVLDDSWVQQSRKKGTEANTGHLDGLKWEVLVVDEPIINACCMPGGKIIVYTGLLEYFRTDAEIATILGHEVGHAIARHVAEGITKNLWFAILQLILYQFVTPDIVNTMSALLLRLPFSRRMEMEADYIGLLLMASAGYDPRVAPSVYEKLGKISGASAPKDYLSTHPSGKKRAQLLAQAKVMDEALMIYREAQSGKGIEGFL